MLSKIIKEKKCSFLFHFCPQHYFVRPLDHKTFPPCILVRSTFTALTEPSVPVGGPESRHLCSIIEGFFFIVKAKNLNKFSQTWCQTHFGVFITGLKDFLLVRVDSFIVFQLMRKPKNCSFGTLNTVGSVRCVSFIFCRI